MRLWEYSGKRIRITDIDGQVFVGFGSHYTSGLDNPDGIPTFSLDPDFTNEYYINFEEAEIAAIEVLDRQEVALCRKQGLSRPMPERVKVI
ncbi:MAG: hypothetical protein LBE35_02855 [Clostridiales bacterium]|jgi:hypothetical protein|nr:hypothetical protein [Clostridiales bacterium]